MDHDVRHDLEERARVLAGILAGPFQVLTIGEVARVVGGLSFVERRLFEVLGRVAVTQARAARAGGPRAAVARWASGASLAAAWRREQLKVLLPISTGLPDPGELEVSPSPVVDEGLGHLADAFGGSLPGESAEGGPAGTGAPSVALETPSVSTSGNRGLVQVGEVWYPALLGAYEMRRSRISVAAEQPLEQACNRLVVDLGAARRRLDELSHRLAEPGRGA